MNNFIEILIPWGHTIFAPANLFFSALSDAFGLSAAGGGLTFAFALSSLASPMSEGVLAAIRRWHGSIDEKFGNIDNLLRLIGAHQPAWTIPAPLLAQLTDNRNQLQTLINKCRTTAGSAADRALRNSLLKSTVELCLLRVRIWAYGQFDDGLLTADDVHQLGFRLPGEVGGRRSRSEATDVTAEVKVSIVNEDFIRVVIDPSAGENAARVARGWPRGVRNALIVITADDGTTEIYRQLTTHLHNDIRMPEGSHGKQFIIKAAFLKHVDDEPRFGNEPTFSMPLTTADLAASHGRQHQEDVDAYRQEIEQLRKEIERLREELRTKS